MAELKNHRHEIFIREYLKDRNATQAAIRAGYSARSAHSQGHDILKRPDVQERLRELTGEVLDKLDVSVDRILRELAAIAFADARDIFDTSGALLPIHQMPAHVAATIAAIECEVRTEGRGDDAVPVQLRKIRRWDKLAALKMLAEYRQMLRPADSGADALMGEVAEMLRDARARAQKAVGR
jgi:phage terminase small subunit